MNERINIMLQSRQIEELAAVDEEVTMVWGKALDTYRASSTPGLTGDPALSLVYQAALQAATAVVRAAGYRVRGGRPPSPHVRHGRRPGSRRPLHGGPLARPGSADAPRGRLRMTGTDDGG